MDINPAMELAGRHLIGMLAQVTERVALTPASNEDKDECRDLSERFGGTLGGVHYEQPERKTQEEMDDTTCTCSWRGEEIVGISPNTNFLPFYAWAE